MKTLHRNRCLEALVVVVAMLLALAAPAVGEETTPGESPTEPPTEAAPAPEAPPAPSSGWVPQGSGAGSGGSGAGSAERGSSLGSGAARKSRPESTSEAPSYTPPPSYTAPEAPSTPTYDEPASAAPVEQQSRPVAPAPEPEPEPAPARRVKLGVAGASAVSWSDTPKAGNVGSPLRTVAAPFTDQRDPVGSDSGLLSLLALIVFGALLAYTAGRLVFGPIELLRR